MDSSTTTLEKKLICCCFPRKMEKSYLFAPVLLWLIFQWGEEARGAPEGSRTAAVAPPTLLPPPEDRQGAPPTQWDLLGGNVSKSAVQRQGRTQPPASASPLEGLLPVGRPHIRRTSPQERPGVVQLLCQVPEGQAEAIEWKRDGKTVAVAKDHSHPANLSAWSFPDTEGPPCGSYSCNASNTFSWKESDPLSLAFPDPVAVVLEASFQIAVSALVFAVFCGWAILLPICQPPKLKIRGQAWRWLSIYANGVACLASLLALVATALWTYAQGLPAVLILPIILLVYVVMVTSLLVATLTFQLKVLHQGTDKSGPAQRILDHIAPGGVILVSLTCGLIIKDICQLQAKGCAGPVDLTAVVAATSGMCLVPYTTISVRYCMDLRRQDVQERISRRKKWTELQAMLRKNVPEEKPSSVSTSAALSGESSV